MVLHPHFNSEVYLEGEITRLDSLNREHQGPRAVLNALERLASDYASEIARTKQNLAVAESQLRDYRASLGKPFDHETYLAHLAALRDQLKFVLSGHEEEAARKINEAAQKIKALRAEHTVDAAPERAAQRRIDAEEPVTTRIRRRNEVPVVSKAFTESAFDLPSTQASATEMPIDIPQSTDQAATIHRERIAQSRRQANVIEHE
jgi:hypothetical protein